MPARGADPADLFPDPLTKLRQVRFYTNFVIFPTVLLMGIGLLADLVAIVLALTGLRGEGRKPALLALAIAVVAPVLAMAVIQLLQLD